MGSGSSRVAVAAEAPSASELVPPTPTSPAGWVLPAAERGRSLADFFELAPPPNTDSPRTRDEMGRGHYGVVQRARRRADGASVAVKTVAKRRRAVVDMLRSGVNGCIRAG